LGGDRGIVTGGRELQARSGRVQIEISTRHGVLGPEQHAYLQEKAEKLVKYFGRLMAIEVAVDHTKNAWGVEIRVSAEHKHDFFASESGPTPAAAMDQCVHKIEQQLRKYKERVQNHKGDVTLSGAAPSSDLPEPPESS
jgi:putative sigma-54 modulation protein